MSRIFLTVATIVNCAGMALILKDGRCPLVDPSGLPQTSPPASLKCGWSFELSFVVKKQLVGFGQFDGFCKCILMD